MTTTPAGEHSTTITAGRFQQNRWIALAVLCLPLLIVSLDNTVLNVVLPTLVRKLHTSDTQLQWIVDAYVLAFGGLMLASGTLADRIGRKLTFCIGLAIFAATSVWAAFSGDANVLIAARAAMGIGATLIMPATLSLISNIFTDPIERQRALGIWAGTTGAGVALGPLVGGVLLDHFAWGSVFLINVPIAIIAFGLAIPFVPASRNEHADPLDWRGAVLSVAGLGLLLWAIIDAPTYGWTSTRVLVIGIAGLAVLAAFTLWEGHTRTPMLKLHFFTKRAFSGSVVGITVLMFTLTGAMFVLTQFLQFQLGNSALTAGIHMLPAAGGIAVIAPLSSVFVRFLGTKITVAIGLLIAAGGLYQISGSTIDTHYSQTLLGTIMLGVGAGMVMPTCVGALMGSLPIENAGIGSATNGTFVQVGSALGVGIIGSVMTTRYQNGINTALAGHAVPATIHGTITGSLGGALQVAKLAPGGLGVLLAHAARVAFMSGMNLGLDVSAGIAAAGAIVALIALPLRALHASDDADSGVSGPLATGTE